MLHMAILDNAFASFSEGLIIAREVNDWWLESRLLRYSGFVYQDKGELEQALKSYNQALLIARETGDKQLEQDILMDIEYLPESE
jgi:tetratricopeptide (TPR) repeat protein